MALMFAICRPQPNWIPKNPKLMFQICQKLSSGLRNSVPRDAPAPPASFLTPGISVVAPILNPPGHAIPYSKTRTTEQITFERRSPPASTFPLPASSFQLPASRFQLPASSFQLVICWFTKVPIAQARIPQNLRRCPHRLYSVADAPRSGPARPPHQLGRQPHLLRAEPPRAPLRRRSPDRRPRPSPSPRPRLAPLLQRHRRQPRKPNLSP